jgi:hypothetical protein
MRNCMECQKPLRGRSDKKFCDYTCKNLFHNRESSKLSEQVRIATEKIRCNREIVDRLFKLGIRKIDVNALRESNFDFMYLFPKAEKEFICLDYLIRMIRINRAEISRIQDP